MPKVSVIVPNFNHSKYLKQRIESILNQSYQDFELILMDDCSTDDSRKIIDSYAGNPRVTHIIYNEHNSGSTFKQWKKGISIAEGDYIWIAESDDWCEPTLLETLVEGFNKDKDCVISYCQSYCINDSHEIRFRSGHPNLSEIVDGKAFIKNYLAVPVSIFNASMALWKRDKFQFISDEFTTFRFCGDWYFWIQLSRLGTVHISGKLLNYFRKHGNDVSSKAYQSGLNFIEELKIINLLYTEELITKKGYHRAYEKKFFEYWFVRNSIDKTNKLYIKNLFSDSLSPLTIYLILIPAAMWKQFRRNLKK